jgi:hypothetical protein
MAESFNGQIIIDQFKRNDAVHDPENEFHIFIDNVIGKPLDYFEELTYIAYDKSNILTNIPEEDETLEEESLTTTMLDLYGEVENIPRIAGENNSDYRARLIIMVENDLSVLGLKNVLSHILNLEKTLIDVENKVVFRAGDKVYSKLSDKRSNCVYTMLHDYNVFITIPDIDFDLDFLKNIIEQSVPLGLNVEIIKGG